MQTRLALLILVPLWTAYLLVVLLIYVTHEHGAGDFVAYYKASLAVVQGQNIYIDLLAPKPFLYPPLLAQLFAPVVAVFPNFRMASLVWFAISIAALLAGTTLLARELPTERERIVLWFAVLFFTPILNALWIGQVTVLMFFLSAAAWVTYRQGLSGWAGALVALACWIKIYPAIIVIYFVLKRDWRALRGVIIASVVIIIFQTVVSGLDTMIEYFTVIFPSLLAEGQVSLTHSNNSVLGFAQRTFGLGQFTVPLIDSPVLLAVTRYGLTLLLLGLLGFFTLRWTRGDESKRLNLEFGLATAVSLLLSSTLHLHGFVSLLVVYVIVWSQVRSRPPLEPQYFLVACMLSYSLIVMQFVISLGYQAPQEKSLSTLELSGPFFGAMVLILIIIVAFVRLPRNVLK